MKAILPWVVTIALCLAGHHAAAQVSFALSATLTNRSCVSSVVAADVNSDGKPDLAFIRNVLNFLLADSTDKHVYVWTNAGNGVFGFNASYDVGLPLVCLITADVNNDKKPDLITVDNLIQVLPGNGSGYALTVLTNDGTGSFALASTLVMGTLAGPVSVAAADLFGRGRPDLVCANFGNGTFTVWTNRGGGLFASNASYYVFPSLSSIAAADVNGDHLPDIVVVGPASGGISIHLWTNNGAGGFASGTAMLPVNTLYEPYRHVVVADVNNDAKPDLVLGYGSVLVLTNGGSAGFAVAGNFPAGPGDAVAVADVNGDEKPDLITCNASTNTLTVLTNAGGGVFGFNTTLIVGNEPESVVVADVNGDGRMDLASGNYGSLDSVTVLTNASTFLPRLTLKHSGTDFIVSWPAIWANWSLQQSTNLGLGVWTGFAGPIGNDGTTESVTNSPSGSTRFFRLSNP